MKFVSMDFSQYKDQMKAITKRIKEDKYFEKPLYIRTVS